MMITSDDPFSAAADSLVRDQLTRQCGMIRRCGVRRHSAAWPRSSARRCAAMLVTARGFMAAPWLGVRSYVISCLLTASRCISNLVDHRVAEEQQIHRH